MQRRFLPFALLAAMVSAACADEVPTLSGGEQFPPGGIAVTREVILPASRFFTLLGSFSGYTDASDAPYTVAANQYEGALNANALARLGAFPRTVTYTRSGTTRQDSLFRYADSRLVLGVDSAAAAGVPFTVEVYELAQRWDARTATWTLAVDSAGDRVAWTQAGGTRGTLLGSVEYGPASGDSVVLNLPAATVVRLADTLSQGILVRVATPGSRVEFSDVVLRAAVRPDSALPDTTIIVTVRPTETTTVYTPEQPEPPAGVLAVGGIRSARTLVRLNLEQTVPACASGQTCGEVPLTEVQLNEVAILLRPRSVPLGFGALTSLPLALRLVEEPELGGAAPLGATLLDADPSFSRGDTVVALPVTRLAAALAANDSLPRTFALVSEVSSALTGSRSNLPPSFGVAFFDPDARLRIVYTLPARRTLP